MESLIAAIKEFEEKDSKGLFVKENIIKNTKSFTEERFVQEFSKAVDETIEKIKVK